MNSATLSMIPRDGLFCKDGRGWFTSESGRGHGLDWPWPSTILGAVRTAWGWQYEDTIGRQLEPHEWPDRTSSLTLGRSLVLRRKLHKDWTADCRIWPVPADALYLEEQENVEQLKPVPSTLQTLGRDDDDAREKLWVPGLHSSKKPMSKPRWWNEKQFADWLSEQPVFTAEQDCRLEKRIQSHVKIDSEKLVAAEGVLFCHDIVETVYKDCEWAIGVDVPVLPSEASTIVSSKFSTLGSDGRLVRWEHLPSEVFASPERLLKRFEEGISNGLRVVAITPLHFQRGWLPDGFESVGGEYIGRLPGIQRDLILRAAFVQRPVYISGWDMAKKKPKPASRMVAPGAVYFFEPKEGNSFSVSDAEALWLSPIGGRTDEGYGRIVPGIWTIGRKGE